MKKIFKSRKVMIWASAAVSLMGVLVAAISTYAWFQIESQPLANTMVTASPNISIDNENVYGYKVNPVLGTNGFVDYANTTVTKLPAEGTEMSTGNDDQDTADTNFDVPSGGIGYYMIKKNPGGTFKYTYNSVSYSAKFENEYSTASRAFITSFTFAANDVVRIKHYTFVDNKTVNSQIKITSVSGASATYDAETGDVTVVTGGTYKVWLDYDEQSLGFETVQSIDGKNINNRINRPNNSIQRVVKPPKYNASSTNTKSNIDTGTTFSQIGFQKTYDDGANADWYVHSWGSGGGTTWPGTKVGSNWNHSETSATNWVSAPSGFESHTGFIVVRMQPNTSNEWNRVESTISSSDPKNFFKITGSGLNVTTERMSNLKIYHVKDNSTTLIDTIGVWNKNSVSSTMTDAGYYAPSYDYYTFNGWFKDSSCTVSFSDGYISHDTNIYAKFTKNSPSGSTFTTYLYDEVGTSGSPTWPTPKVYAWNSSGTYEPTVYTHTSVSTHSHNGTTHNVYRFDISTSFTHFLFRNNNSTGGTNQTVDLAKANGQNKYYVMNSTSGGNRSGNWYSALASTSTYTYYYYDNSSPRKLGDTPHAYTWASAGVDGSGNDKYTIFPYRTSTWEASPAMTPYSSWSSSDKTAFTTAHPNVDTSNVWRIQASQSYDKIIFNNGTGGTSNSDQTIDETATGHNGWFFVLTGDASGGKWDGVWCENVFSIVLKASFFITDTSGVEHKSSIASDELGRDYSFGVEPYRAPSSGYNSDIIKTVAADGILYRFNRSGTTTWYTNEDCTSTYSPTTVNSSTILYAKFVTDLDDYSTFYIDATSSGTDSSGSNKWVGNVYVADSGGTAAYFSAPCVAPDLYKATFPNNWQIKLTNGASGYGNTSGNNWSETVDLSSQPSGYDLLHINQASYGSNHSTTWCVSSVMSNTKYGTASIYVSSDGSSWGSAVATMEIGDGNTSNYFVYEHGLQIASGKYVKVVVTGGTPASLTKTYDYAQYVATKPIYVTNGGSNKIKLANYTGNARFNFYITKDTQLSIAMVPDYGNGYYIMDYNSTYGTNNFIGAKKMNSGSDNHATYTGFYANSGEKIFIRSYVDAVDILYTETSSLCANVSIQTNDAAADYGVITFGSAGYYNIFVTNGKIKIENYQLSDFFKLNPLDVNNKANQAAIRDQKTALILEVPFTCNNTYASKISLRTDFGNLSNFVGTALYVTNSQISNNPATVYSTVVSNAYGSLSNSATCNDANNLTIAAGSATTYYAYILIDYRYNGTYTNFNNSAYLSASMSFYLSANQYAS